MDFNDFSGPKGPVGEPWGLHVVYFFSSRNKHDFCIDFEPQNGSLFEPFGRPMRLHVLTGGGPGTHFGIFVDRGTF